MQILFVFHSVRVAI